MGIARENIAVLHCMCVCVCVMFVDRLQVVSRFYR